MHGPGLAIALLVLFKKGAIEGRAPIMGRTRITTPPGSHRRREGKAVLARSGRARGGCAAGMISQFLAHSAGVLHEVFARTWCGATSDVMYLARAPTRLKPILRAAAEARAHTVREANSRQGGKGKKRAARARARSGLQENAATMG